MRQCLFRYLVIKNDKSAEKPIFSKKMEGEARVDGQMWAPGKGTVGGGHMEHVWKQNIGQVFKCDKHGGQRRNRWYACCRVVPGQKRHCNIQSPGQHSHLLFFLELCSFPLLKKKKKVEYIHSQKQQLRSQNRSFIQKKKPCIVSSSIPLQYWSTSLR